MLRGYIFRELTDFFKQRSLSQFFFKQNVLDFGLQEKLICCTITSYLFLTVFRMQEIGQ
jgi:hypothetical protein